MRLTLRTLLAYLDEAPMSAENRQQLQQKLSDSAATQAIVDRIQSLMVQPRMGCPAIETAGTLDVNNVAQYLDGCLDAALVKRFEQVSVKNDGALAEVASVHQVLTRMVEQPIDVPPRLRERIYQIPFDLQELTAVDASTWHNGNQSHVRSEDSTVASGSVSADEPRHTQGKAVDAAAVVPKSSIDDDRSLGRQELEAASGMLLPINADQKAVSVVLGSSGDQSDELAVASQAMTFVDAAEIDAAEINAAEQDSDAAENGHLILVPGPESPADSKDRKVSDWRWAIVLLVLFALCCVWWNMPTQDQTAGVVDDVSQQHRLEVGQGDVQGQGDGKEDAVDIQDVSPWMSDLNASANAETSQNLGSSDAAIAGLSNANTGLADSASGPAPGLAAVGGSASSFPLPPLPPLPGAADPSLQVGATVGPGVGGMADRKIPVSMIPALAEDPSQSLQEDVTQVVEATSLYPAQSPITQTPNQWGQGNSGASESASALSPAGFMPALPGTASDSPWPNRALDAASLAVVNSSDGLGGSDAWPGLPPPASTIGPSQDSTMNLLAAGNLAAQLTGSFAIQPLPPIESSQWKDQPHVDQGQTMDALGGLPGPNQLASEPLSDPTLSQASLESGLPVTPGLAADLAGESNLSQGEPVIDRQPADDAAVQWLEQIGTVVVEDEDSSGQPEDWVMVLPGGLSKLTLSTKLKHKWSVMFSGISKYSLQQVDESQRLAVRRCFMVLRSSAENETFQINTPKGDFFITPLSPDSEMVIEVRPFLPAGFTADTTAPRFYLGCLGVSGKFVVEHNQHEEILVPNKWLVVKPDGQVEQFKSEVPEMIATAIQNLRTGQVSEDVLLLSEILNSSYGLTKLSDMAKGAQVQEQGGTIELRSLAGVWSYYLGRMEPVVSILDDPRLKEHWENHIQTIASCLQTEPAAILQLERAFVDQLLAKQVSQRFAGYNPQAIKKSQMTQLVDDLSSQNLARRILAAYALKQLTHETYDYDPLGDEDSFKQSITRWRQWLEDSTTARISLSPAAALVPNAKK